MKNNFFVLHQDCQIVKGYKNILLFDLYRKVTINITQFYSLFIDDKYIKNINENSEIITLLLEEDLGSIGTKSTDHKKLNWFTSNSINEIIIEFSSSAFSDIEFICNKIKEIGVEYLQIRFVEESFINLNKFLNYLSDSCIRTIEIVYPFNQNTSKNDTLIKLANKTSRVQVIYFYNAPFNRSVQQSGLFTIIYYEKNLINNNHCGVVSLDYFMIDIKNFSKAKNYNNCLKDKLFIDWNGEIKNCPAFVDSFMNIRNLSLNSLDKKIKNDKIRNITKDFISICKDCEFRYICTDCRAYTEDPTDIYSKPLKCGYNPYTGEWEEWSKNPLKQKAIQHYGMDDII